ncbi:DNA damage-binding protein 2 [Lonchura striata]|uniref:DNA damage-binding protein 2 n=1 Tax=Lonchura striata TaxID=40157 RepID=A0A218VAM4_9PASE|nr:DNA damage-binding protein 2 [Lonchura striata domestica]
MAPYSFLRRWSDRMAPVNQPKDKKRERACQHWSEEAKSAGKRKRDYGERGNEKQEKKLFVRKASRPSGKIGCSGGGFVMRNKRVLSSQLERRCSIVHYVYQKMLGGSMQAQLRQVRSVSFRTWPGDSLGDIKFSPYEAEKLYVASGDGTLSLQDLEGRAVQVISRALDCGHEHHNVCCWYCSVDVSASCRAVVTGDNVGNVVLLSTSGEEVWKLKLHKKKVTHVEFNSRCEWMFATASVDQTVKIWDLRNIKNKTNFLHLLPHEKPVNAAYFSPTHGAKLLSTDQHNEIRVYSSSDWTKPQHLIPHPHRQFQHLTPIKATWHPRYDLIVVGRYPDPKFPGYTLNELRTVDVFDGNTGEMVCQLYDPNASGIISLNKFNPMGDTLASGMGFNILIWNQEEMAAKKHEHLLKAMTNEEIEP